MYVVECECGERKTFQYSCISYNNTVCECPHWLIYGDIRIKTNQIKDRRLAKIFYGMLRRCYNTSDKDYKYYGKKGIVVYQQWIDNPNLFEEWALQNGYKENLTIDRIKEDKNYTPDNCRWIDKKNKHAV